MDLHSLSILFALIAMFTIGLNSVFISEAAKRMSSVKVVFYRGLIIVALLPLFFLGLSFFIPVWPSNIWNKYLLATIIIAILSYIPLLTFAKALRVGKVGVITPIAGSAVMFTVLLFPFIAPIISFFFPCAKTPESITFWKFISILLVIFGIFLNAVDLKKIKFRDFFFSGGIVYALISSILWGIFYCVIGIPISIFGPLLTCMIIELVIMICGAINLKIRKESFSVSDKKSWKYLFFVGISGGLASLFFNMGIQFGDMVLVATVFSANPLVSTLYARSFLNEKLTAQQWCSVFVILIGIILILNS